MSISEDRFWEGVQRVETRPDKIEPWQHYSHDLGAIFDTNRGNYKKQYYRLWCEKYYPDDQDRWQVSG